MTCPANKKAKQSQEDEPKCLVPRSSPRYRQGLGFTCRQITLPMLAIIVLFFGLSVISGMSLANTGLSGAKNWLFFALSISGLILAIRGILYIQRSLVTPLSEVSQWVTTVRTGRLDARMPELEHGEFSDLSNEINKLAGLIQTLDEDIEIEVDVQTQRMASKTQALELLYEVVTSVNEAYEVDDLLIHFMRRLGAAYGAEGATVRVLQDGELKLLDSYGLPAGGRFLDTKVPIQFVLQSGLFGHGTIDVQSESVSDTNIANVNQIISMPLQYRDSILGCYQLFLDKEISLLQDTRELLQSVGQHLGVAIEQSRLDQEAGRLMLVEERSRLANELHDSLAQTLASLRFQVRVLDETMHQDDEREIWQELEKMELRIEEANRELRSLIGQFRAPLQSQEIVMSVEKLIRKFRQDTGIAVFFQNEWNDDNLDTEMRTDVIRIVQECLTNIKKHARAKTVRVLIRHQNHHYRVMVEDDGVGINDSANNFGTAGEHIGTQIMYERAESLGATLKIESEPGEGCLVSLEFRDHLDDSESTQTLAVG